MKNKNNNWICNIKIKNKIIFYNKFNKYKRTSNNNNRSVSPAYVNKNDVTNKTY
jgi:hypothetical protein